MLAPFGPVSLSAGKRTDMPANGIARVFMPLKAQAHDDRLQKAYGFDALAIDEAYVPPVATERPRQHIGQVQHTDAFEQSHRPLPVSPTLLRSGDLKFFLKMIARCAHNRCVTYSGPAAYVLAFPNERAMRCKAS
jgi:hypothetical protein